MSVQCKACPWKKSTKPALDIPNGYSAKAHCALKSTIAEPGAFPLGAPVRIMACHESEPGNERPCVGWAVHQIGDGNNIPLRMLARHDERFHDLRTVGPQHERFEDTLPESKREDRFDEGDEDRLR